MRFAFIRVEKAHYPLTVLCRVLLVSTSGFYAWCHREPSDGELRRRALAAKIKASHQASHETYGSPRVTRELRTNGEPVSRKDSGKNHATRGHRGPQETSFQGNDRQSAHPKNGRQPLGAKLHSRCPG